MNRNTTDEYNPLVCVQEFPDDGKLQIIHGYDPLGFRIAGQRWDGPQFILPRLTRSWAVNQIDDLTSAAVTQMTGGSGIELVILGLGSHVYDPLPGLARELRAHGLRTEVMTTPAACRTWNVLLSEGRSAAAGLLPVDKL